MRLMLTAIAFGLVTGWVLGGRLTGIPQMRVRWSGVAVVGFALQLAPLPGRAALLLLYCSFVLLLGFAAVNLRQPGFALILLGILLNLAVIGTNAGMPVAEDAIVASGQQDTVGELARNGDGVKHHLVDPHTRLRVLGDVIAVPPPVRQVISVGDIAVSVGMMWFIVAAMLTASGVPSRRVRGPRAPSHSDTAGVS
jgi:hypothetical protein